MAFRHVPSADSILLPRAVPWRETSPVVEMEEEPKTTASLNYVLQVKKGASIRESSTIPCRHGPVAFYG
jgi:hypothetical protein